jgi:hypothetical protein
MRKKYIHIELVPVEMAEKVLAQEQVSAKRNGNRKLVVKESRRTPGGPHTPKKVAVPAA